MSQEKVDKYKQEKVNRKKTMAKEKLKKRLYILLGAVITAAFVGWIGWSVYAEKKAAAEQEAMISSLQAELNAMATATVATTGTAGTTSGDTTTGDTTTGDTTTGEQASSEQSSSEETTEEETTTSADEKSE